MDYRTKYKIPLFHNPTSNDNIHEILFIHRKNDEGDPITVLFEDKILILLCIIYGLSMILFWMVF